MNIFITLLLLFPSFVIHEFAHAYAANKLGDPTAKERGRLTLNPIKHVDLFGTILLPVMMMLLQMVPIAIAKPVPVNFNRLRNPKRDMMIVAFAGPFVNICLALVLTIIYRIVSQGPISELIVLGIFINLLLAIFNMMPIPPLDGSRIVMGLLPNKLMVSYAKIEPFGIILIIVLLNFGIFQKVVWPITTIIAESLGIPWS